MDNIAHPLTDLLLKQEEDGLPVLKNGIDRLLYEIVEQLAHHGSTVEEEELLIRIVVDVIRGLVDL